MNVYALATNRVLLLALGIVLFTGAVATYGTGAFFSSEAQATGNSFTSGTLTLELTGNQGGGSPTTALNGIWDFDTMAPGGTPSVESVWLRNSGSIDGQSVSVAVGGWTSNPSNIAAQMRITEMTLDGNNLLEDGAGATIPEYEAPVNCTVTLSGSDTITGAIAAASAGDVICASGANYDSAWEGGASEILVDEEVTIASVNGPDQTATIPFRVTADNVTIAGFEVTGPNSTYGVYATDVDNLTVTQNHINDIGTALPSGSAHGVYLKAVSEATTGADFTFNRVENIGNPSLTVSAKGFFLGDTSPSNSIDDVFVAHNIVETVRTSKGAYGLLANHGGGTTNLVVEHNTISDLDGGWEQGVSVYNDTPGAIISFNDMSDFAGVGADAAGVNVENNPSAASVVIENNNFAASVPVGVLNQEVGVTVTAENNWWGDFDPSDQVSGDVDFTPFAGGPFAGFVNGNDANGNGYADLRDLRDDPITGIMPGLDAYDGNNDQEFVLGVQLDGPTTGNTYQGLALEGLDIEFILDQI